MPVMDGYTATTTLRDEGVELPIIGRVHTHKRMEQIFIDVLSELDREGYADLVRPMSIWCVRHKMHRRARSLSTHSWGIACDVRPSHNPPGEVCRIPQEIVHTFEHNGFQWGGRWSRARDDMHFQYCTGY